MMQTSFTLSQDGKTHELSADRVAADDRQETWRVSSRLDTHSFIALTNNRPLLHQKHHYTLRYRWTVLEGGEVYKKMVSQITTYLEYFIKGQWKPPKKSESKAPLAPQGKLF